MTVASTNSSPAQLQESDRVVRATVVLVDDDDLFRESVGLNLADEGYDVVAFNNGPDALAHLRSSPDVGLVLLDWRMPGMDGIEVLRQMRADRLDVPVIFLTVLSDQIYEEAALSGGAVDFVEKSRSFSILLKRMSLILDGRKLTGDEAASGDEPTILTLGPLELNLESCRATWHDRQVDLTLTEFNIVRLMATQPGADVSYREIYDVVRGKGFVAGYGAFGYRANVRAFIKRIRQKFRSVDPEFEGIHNYPGFGYRWVGDDATGS